MVVTDSIKTIIPPIADTNIPPKQGTPRFD